MKNNENRLRKMSRSELKNVSGGYAAPGGNCIYILFCTTPNGTESWRRCSMSGNANTVCQGIYPAYGSATSGQWSEEIIIISSPH